MDKETALLYAQLPKYKNKVDKTERFIEDSLSKVDNPYLACSFGKDSSVMLHLVLKFKPDIRVKFLTKIETRLVDDYDSIIRWWQENHSIDFEEICYQGWLENPDAKKGIGNNITTDGHDSYFVGIRSEESKGRFFTLTTMGQFAEKKDGLIRISPMAWWTTRDIATYMLTNDLPLLYAYRKEGFSARTTTNIASKHAEESIARLKERDIESYNKLLKILPDAKYFT